MRLVIVAMLVTAGPALAGCGAATPAATSTVRSGARVTVRSAAPRHTVTGKRHGHAAATTRHRAGRHGATRPMGRLATVDHLVDGDTVAIATPAGAREVRLIGIDTPETKRPDTPVECGGPQAFRHMASLLAAGDRVRLIADPTQDRVDRYGRLLRYVIHDGNDLGLSQIEAGWAEVYVYGDTPFERVRHYRRAARSARAAGRGDWGACHGDFHSARDHAASSPSPTPTSPTPTSPGGPPGRSGASHCDPNYRGACLDPNAPDYDCAGGDGNGPRYVHGPITIVGDDHYHLDSDGDGVACESP